MNEFELTLRYKVLKFKEATEEIRHLVNEATKACAKAHAPYSGFRVGAALLLNTSEILTGSNQENAAYPSGLCAERVALFQFGHFKGDQFIKKVAISVPQIQGEEFIPPCGACLQVFAEYRQKQTSPIEIILSNGTELLLIAPDINTFLPFAFTGRFLK